MSYTKQEIIEKLEKGIKDMSTLYQTGKGKNPYINYTGNVKEKEPYYNVIAEYLLDHNVKELFGKIKGIKRETYKTPEHEKKIKKEKDKLIENYEKKNSKKEKWLAKNLFAESYFHGKEYDYIGKLIDFETPIKATKKDTEVGDVDLIGYNEKNKCLSLIELKKENNTETMLRAILEIATYYCQICKEKLKKEFCPDAEIKEIKKVVLVFKEQYKQYKQSVFLQKLAVELEVVVYILEKDGNKYEVIKAK